mmetsp:Transcript_16235/g.39989  ORF Transcript_16235/g.39989 Transcript_16235/m.39989 type:complete len:242 (-) Transcript_16235:229-954(-)
MIGSPYRTKLGSLNGIVFQTHEDVDFCVVMMHGFGANSDDLASLAKNIANTVSEFRIRFVFPEAPLQLQPGSYAWWSLDIQQLMMKMMQDGPDHLFKGQSDKIMKDSQRRIEELITSEMRKFDLQATQVILSGFSQGSWLATQVALSSKVTYGGLVVLSGGLYVPESWPLKAQEKGRNLRVLQTHGTMDSILPFRQGMLLENMFKAAGSQHKFISFNGDHTIPREAIGEIGSLLKRIKDTA